MVGNSFSGYQLHRHGCLMESIEQKMMIIMISMFFGIQENKKCIILAYLSFESSPTLLYRNQSEISFCPRVTRELAEQLQDDRYEMGEPRIIMTSCVTKTN